MGVNMLPSDKNKALEALEQGQGEFLAPKGEFIHLKNARFYTGGTNPPFPSDGTWWRGRVDDVMGFTFGVMYVGSK